MSINIPEIPTQAEPPDRLGHRVVVDAVVEADVATVTIEYEVQEQHQELGYRVVEGGSRKENVGHDTKFRHWFVLDGPGPRVVDMRIRVLGGGETRTRGFAVALTA